MLEDILIKHEGVRQFCYLDTLGYHTIGVGRNIDRRNGKGLSDEEIKLLLKNDIDDCRRELKGYKFYDIQDDVRKDVLVEMCFNLGKAGLMKFKMMLGALSVKDYKTAVREAKRSKWATQIGRDRLNDILYRMEFGQYAPAT
jgi:lysozyme